MTAYAEAQPVYLLAGWPSVLPLPHGKKQHPPKGFTGRKGVTPDEAQHGRWLATKQGGNVALRMPTSVVGIDVDNYGSKVGARTLADRERTWGALPPTWRSTSRTDDPVSGIRYFRVPLDLIWHDVGPDVETIWWGARYSLVWPSTHPDTGATYCWFGPDSAPSEPPSVDQFPSLPKAWVDGLTREHAKREASHAPAASSAARVESWAQAGMDAELAKIRSAANGSRDTTINTAAYSVGQLVGGGFLNAEEATAALVAAGLATGQEKALVVKTVQHAMADGIANPRTGPTAKPRADEGRVPLDDSPLAQWVADRLSAHYCWAGGLGWLAFNGKVWRPATDATVTEAVRTEFRELNKREIDECTDVQRLKRLPDLLRAGKIRAVVGLLRGIIEADAGAFDQHPDLLNVANGVIDLRTGELLPHDPALRLTKFSPTKFVPGASHPDWAQALRALPEDVADWMQWRFGQAASGHATPDQLLPVLYGNGANGKSTLLTGITGCLGDHAVSVPERVLLSNPNDHPTELMTLRGARMAVIEETPEARHLSVKRLKDTVGTPKITARKIRQDNVEWTASHSLFLTSNYRPRVDETDHGTWRRLALIQFPFTFRAKPEDGNAAGDKVRDASLLQKIQSGAGGRHEAVLAWIVAGAVQWYRNDQVLPDQPQRVLVDTAEWRAESDLIFSFINEALDFDEGHSILSSELYAEFCHWHAERGHQKSWTDQTFTARFGGHDEVARHGVTKTRTRTYGVLSSKQRTDGGAGLGNPRVWVGLRFRQDDRATSEPLWEGL